jgi:hypothetical protein
MADHDAEEFCMVDINNTKEELRQWSGYALVMLGQPETRLDDLRLDAETEERS